MFEVITSGGNKFRHREPHQWRYGIKSGSIDVEDKTIVEVFFEDDNDEIIFCSYSQVIRVGKVDEETTLCMPEETINRCPRCGYSSLVEKREVF